MSVLRRAGEDPAAIRLALLAEHYRADRMWSDAVLDQGRARLERWRAATSATSGPDAAPVIARVREHLADDLDTPKALAAIDGWCRDVEQGIGQSATAPGDLASAVEALLGVELSHATR